MPNFGLKCFLGSFAFSLLTVFAVTKGYFVLTEEQSQSASKSIETVYNDEAVHNIELYTQNDEADQIYEKFKKVSAPAQVQMPLHEDNQEAINQNDEEYDDISDTLAFDGEQTGDIIYDPDEEDNISDFKEKNKEDKSAKMLADEKFDDEVMVDEKETDIDELQIAKAEEVDKFIIPLKHSFSVTTIGGTSVSSETKDSKTALASQDVQVQAQTSAEINSDPWEVAKASNPHITKNKIAQASQKHKEDVAALDKEKNSEAGSEKETKVAYKMMKNILIPIPDEIANDENLTPQLSYSAENKKLDAKLKNKKDTEQKQKEKQEQEEKEKNKINEEQSKSLSDSITDWFAQGKDKEKVDVIKEDSKIKERVSDKEADANQEEDDDEGVFSKLLGLKKKNSKSIIPSELKLSFQPNRAEISGQTLEWLHAFSHNAVKDDEVMIEIRIDGSGSYELQQKRLNLLYTIFSNNGVNYDKINIIFTARDPNSFIIRNVKYALKDNAPKEETKKSGPWY